MFRSRVTPVVCLVAVSAALPCCLFAQEESAPGFKLKPNVVVQEEIDGETLTDKVSFYMGYSLMQNLKNERRKFDKQMLIKGMQAAIDGTDGESFIIGFQLMKGMQQQGAELKTDKIMEGLDFADAGKEFEMSDEQFKAMMKSFRRLTDKQVVAKAEAEAAKNGAAAEAYMAENAAKPNVKKLPNGVQYEVLVEGTGPSPSRKDRVRVDYHGTFLDGTVFDSTTKHPSGRPPQPAEFPVGGVVPGFSAALQAMKVGGKWRVVIPGDLGYGVAGQGSIGPNQALIFELSLLEILDKPNSSGK